MTLLDTICDFFLANKQLDKLIQYPSQPKQASSRLQGAKKDQIFGSPSSKLKNQNVLPFVSIPYNRPQTSGGHLRDSIEDPKYLENSNLYENNKKITKTLLNAFSAGSSADISQKTDLIPAAVLKKQVSKQVISKNSINTVNQVVSGGTFGTFQPMSGNAGNIMSWVQGSNMTIEHSSQKAKELSNLKHAREDIYGTGNSLTIEQSSRLSQTNHNQNTQVLLNQKSKYQLEQDQSKVLQYGINESRSDQISQGQRKQVRNRESGTLGSNREYNEKQNTIKQKANIRLGSAAQVCGNLRSGGSVAPDSRAQSLLSMIDSGNDIIYVQPQLDFHSVHGWKRPSQELQDNFKEIGDQSPVVGLENLASANIFKQNLPPERPQTSHGRGRKNGQLIVNGVRKREERQAGLGDTQKPVEEEPVDRSLWQIDS